MFDQAINEKTPTKTATGRNLSKILRLSIRLQRYLLVLAVRKAYSGKNDFTIIETYSTNYVSCHLDRPHYVVLLDSHFNVQEVL